jgi:hypothetical protein
MMVPIMCGIELGRAANSWSAAGIARLSHVPAAAVVRLLGKRAAW